MLLVFQVTHGDLDGGRGLLKNAHTIVEMSKLEKTWL